MTLDIPALALDWHRAGRQVALATVVETWGSAPRPVGAQLVIDGAGAMEGSVSGGCVEGAVVVEAIEALGDGAPRVLDYGVSDDEAFAVGLACGGRIRVLVEPVGSALPEALLAELVAARAARRPVAYVTDLQEGGPRLEGRDAHAERFRADRSSVAEDGRTFVAIHNPPLRMIVVGAVHIAQALLPMARACGYDPVLVDPRPAFGAAARFPGETILEDWPDEALAAQGLDARCCVVTLTHDPKLDDPAIMAALRLEVFYLGCLGSTRTHAKRVERLRQAEFTDDEIGRIHAPVGLDIGARSPAEIAVSVMAQITGILRARPMRFGPVPLAEAEGAILAHSLRRGGLRLKKGTRLGPADLAALRGAGIDSVVAARLAPEDVDENTAAARLARALVGDGAGLRLSEAATGRVNVHAAGPGLARIDAARIEAANRIDPAITVATVPPWQRCAEGTMIATVKIAYAVPEPALEAACAAAAGGLGFAAPRIGTAALIETETGRPASDKGARATEERLRRLAVGMAPPVRVPHEPDPLAAALAARDEELLLILTGSATSDAQDVAPEALRRAGGALIHFGMPVDPGNLLFLGTLAGRPVIGLPGCARSPALNGADWVLERVVCGVPVGPSDIAGMGVGGLLKEIPTRPRPRDHAGG